jgi:uncharacterized repeat protein (TIGR03847 family)
MDLGSVDRITADAIGEPGMRTFYVQARAGAELVTVIVEKQQVQLLATSILELLADLPQETGPGPADDELELEVPFEPLWRAGRLSIGYDEEADRFILELMEFVPELEDDDDPRSASVSEPRTVRLHATREQMLALSRHGAEVAERGRPTCQLCGNPIDPEGHACPATNGHRTPRA